MRPALSVIAPAVLAASLAAAAPAQAAPAAPQPKLVVVLSVDQFSADLFSQYRPLFTGGLKRMAQGVVFPSGYQSHAATETCPGHATILTGAHPAHSGIIANNWVDLGAARPDKTIYCAEDEAVPGATFRAYTPSTAHLLVPTLAERMKAANPAARVVAVAGKDRAAIMMAGRGADQMWFLDPFTKNRWRTLAGRTDGPESLRATAAYGAALARAERPAPLPAVCERVSRPVMLSPTASVGDTRFERKAGDVDAMRASPALDAATLALASDLTRTQGLGRDAVTDLLIVGLSATDYVGHRYGTEGSEMCIQLMALDMMLDHFFRSLDRAGLDYAVVLTADHGGHDTPERNRENAIPEAARIDARDWLAVLPENQRRRGDSFARGLGAILGKELSLPGPVIHAADLGDLYFDRGLTPAQLAAATPRAIALLRVHPQVGHVFTKAELAATPLATTPPELWTPIERARASFHPARSGDLVVLLKPRVTPIPEAGVGYIATHGSAWDYDRRVPILFWWKGAAGFEQPNSVQVVDIAPTLAPLVGVTIASGEVDGRCLDLVPGPASSCAR